MDAFSVMSVDDFIQKMRGRNPAIFNAKRITISTEELERLMRIAFKAGAFSTDVSNIFGTLFR